MKFDYALTAALTGAKARNSKAVKALLDMDGLKLNDGKIIGLDEQLSQIKEENAFCSKVMNLHQRSLKEQMVVLAVLVERNQVK